MNRWERQMRRRIREEDGPAWYVHVALWPLAFLIRAIAWAWDHASGWTIRKRRKGE